MDIKLSESITLTKIYQVSNISITITDLQLNQSVSLLISLKDENNFPVDTMSLVLEGERYSLWADEEEYIKSVCLEEIQNKYRRN